MSSFDDDDRAYVRSGSSMDPVSTFKLQISFFIEGLRSATRISELFTLITESPHLLSNLTKSTILQFILLISSIVIKPILGLGNYRRLSTYSIMFNVFYLLPLCAVSIYFTNLFSLRNEVGKKSLQKISNQGLLLNLVKNSNKPLVLLNYIIFVYLLKFIPYIGYPLSFLYASLANSYYIFEPHWTSNSIPFLERVKTLEQRWSYFLAFGLPITLLSFFSSDPIINFSLFSLLFPFLTILSTTSMPQPRDPDLPSSALTINFLPTPSREKGKRGHAASASFSMANAEGGEESRGRSNFFLFPVRMRIFSLAVISYQGLETLIGSSGGRKKEAGGGNGWRGDGNSYNSNSNSRYGNGNGNQNGNYQNGNGNYGNDAGNYPPVRENYQSQPPRDYYNDTPTYSSNSYNNQSSPPRNSQPPQFSSQSPSNPNTAPPPRRAHVASESSVGVSSTPSSNFKISGEFNSLPPGGNSNGTGVGAGVSSAFGGINSRSKKD